MGHGRGADEFVFADLNEPVVRNIAPDVLAEIKEDGVNEVIVVKELDEIVWRIDLGGVKIGGEAEKFDERLTEFGPISFGVEDCVGLETADGAV